MTLASLRPWMIWAAIVVALSAFAGLQTLRLANERTAHQVTRTDHAERVAAMERGAREAIAAARTEEQRRADALQGVIDEAEQKLARSRADAVAASDAGDRLRQRVTELTGTCRGGGPSDTGTASAGKTADATADMLADVQRRIDEATDTIARFADQSRAAGEACERSYRSLTPDSLRR